jgi:hypothetical protein
VKSTATLEGTEALTSNLDPVFQPHALDLKAKGSLLSSVSGVVFPSGLGGNLKLSSQSSKAAEGAVGGHVG